MIKNRSKKNQDCLENIKEQNQLILKKKANYIFKNYMEYVGKQNNAFFYCNRQNYKTKSRLIVIQQQFSLNGQLKLIKKWSLDFKILTFMNKGSQFIALTDFEAFIWRIDKSYNLNDCFTILKFKEDLYYCLNFLILCEKDDLIIISVLSKIQFLIKQDGNWQLLQLERAIGYDSIQGYQFNCKQNIFAVSFKTFTKKNIQKSQVEAFLRVSGYWKKIKKIDLQFNYQAGCFIDNDKFLIFENDNQQQTILSLWQVFSETFEFKELKRQKLKISENLQGLKFINQKELLLAWNQDVIYLIKQKQY